MLQKAYGLQPDNDNYGFALAAAWQNQNAFAQAEAVYWDVLAHLRAQAVNNPTAYRPKVATTLNNLGLFYRATDRLAEAEKAFQEAADIQRALYRSFPAAHGHGLHVTLRNLARVYDLQQCEAERRQVEQEIDALVPPAK